MILRTKTNNILFTIQLLYLKAGKAKQIAPTTDRLNRFSLQYKITKCTVSRDICTRFGIGLYSSSRDFSSFTMAGDVRNIINYQRYPIAESKSHILQEIISRARGELNDNGIALLRDFMLPWAIRQTIIDTEEALPDAFCKAVDHTVYLEECQDSVLEKDHARNILCRSSKCCIAHDQIKTNSPLNQLYMSSEMTNFVRLLLNKDTLYRTADPLGALSLQVYRKNDGLDWHFDQGEFAVTLLLQAPEGGGRFQYIPSTR